MPWTQFWDMHSGGRVKETRDGIEVSQIYIEAPEDEARVIFYNRFGHNPNRVTCTCCGEDYSIRESESLEQATGYQRNCAYGENGYIEEQDTRYGNTKPCIPLAEFLAKPSILVIRAAEITPEERVGEVPRQGYVWVE